MIAFRCWYCNKRYTVAEARVGERVTCTCRHLLRVPKCSGGNSRVKTAVDWLVETAVYGGGGALLGCGLALLGIYRWDREMPTYRDVGSDWTAVGMGTLLGLLVGALFGERGVNWIGRMIRAREER